MYCDSCTELTLKPEGRARGASRYGQATPCMLAVRWDGTCMKRMYHPACAVALGLAGCTRALATWRWAVCCSLCGFCSCTLTGLSWCVLLDRYLRVPGDDESQRLLGFSPEGMPAMPHLRPVGVVMDRGILAAAQRPPWEGEEQNSTVCAPTKGPLDAGPYSTTSPLPPPSVPTPSPVPWCPRPLAWPCGSKGVLVVTPLATMLHLTRGVPADLGAPRGVQAIRCFRGIPCSVRPLYKGAGPWALRPENSRAMELSTATCAGPIIRRGSSLRWGRARGGFTGFSGSLPLPSQARHFSRASCDPALCGAAHQRGLQWPGFARVQPMGQDAHRFRVGALHEPSTTMRVGSAVVPGVQGRQVLRLPGWGIRTGVHARLTLARGHGVVLKPGRLLPMSMYFL